MLVNILNKMREKKLVHGSPYKKKAVGKSYHPGQTPDPPLLLTLCKMLKIHVTCIKTLSQLEVVTKGNTNMAHRKKSVEPIYAFNCLNGIIDDNTGVL